MPLPSVRIARSDFTYLSDSPATIEIALGDARLTLEREPPQRLDVLAVDAFSSDAIPVHRITREAHDSGSALVDVLPLEQAEFRCEQVRSLARPHGYPLTMTLEPAD